MDGIIIGQSEVVAGSKMCVIEASKLREVV